MKLSGPKNISCIVYPQNLKLILCLTFKNYVTFFFSCGEGNGAKSGPGMRVRLAKEMWMLNVLKAMMTLPKRAHEPEIEVWLIIQENKCTRLNEGT